MGQSLLVLSLIDSDYCYIWSNYVFIFTASLVVHCFAFWWFHDVSLMLTVLFIDVLVRRYSHFRISTLKERRDRWLISFYRDQFEGQVLIPLGGRESSHARWRLSAPDTQCTTLPQSAQRRTMSGRSDRAHRPVTLTHAIVCSTQCPAPTVTGPLLACHCRGLAMFVRFGSALQVLTRVVRHGDSCCMFLERIHCRIDSV
jgi:hypothetical protein